MQTDVNAAGSDRSWMSVSMNDLDGFGDQKFPGPCDDVLLNAKAGCTSEGLKILSWQGSVINLFLNFVFRCKMVHWECG